MKRRVLSLLLVFCMVAALLPMSAFAAEESIYQDMFSYTIENGEVTVTGPVTVTDPCPMYACSDIVIPDYIDGYPVTTIADSAFHSPGLEGDLHSITLPSTLKTIERYAFQECTGLTEITIPSSVTYIGQDAFDSCTSLVKVTIGELTTEPAPEMLDDWGQFGQCPIQELTLGNNVQNARPCFPRNALEKVYLAPTVVSFDDSDPGLLPFGNGSATIYGYTGSAAEDYAAEHGHPFVPLDNPAVSLVSTIPENGDQNVTDNTLSMTFSRDIATNLSWEMGSIYIMDADTDQVVQEIDNETFYSLGGTVDGPTVTIPRALRYLTPGKSYYVLMDSNVVTADRVDSEGVLQAFAGITKKTALAFCYAGPEPEPSTTHSIRISTGLKSSEGNTTAVVSVDWDDAWFTESTTTYNHSLATTAMALSGAAYVDVSPDNIQSVFTDLGFEQVYSNYTAPTRQNNNIVSYTFATKYISGQSAPLVAVVIKGTSGNAEWYSNFDIGMDSDHRGFSTACEKMLDELRTYLSDHDLSNIRFLVTGHSRGAGVANLAAAELTREYGKSNVYAYTFAAPTVSANARQAGYENIFNIINGEDFVPRVPLQKWGFSRYGIDLMLPSRSYYFDGTYGANYDIVYERMASLYSSLTDSDYPAYENGTQGVDGLVENVYSLSASVDDYYSIVRQVDPITSGTMSDYFQTLEDYLATDSGLDSFAATLGGSYSKITLFFVANQNGVFSTKVLGAHGMASYFSWMKANSAASLFGSSNEQSGSTFKRLKVACPVDVYVYDEEDALVASVVNEEVVVNTLAISVEDEVKTVDLPAGQAYRVEVVATGTGTVSYTVQERVAQGGETSVLDTYGQEDIPITPGDKLVGQIDDDQSDEPLEYIPAEPISNPFTDLDVNEYYYDPVMWAVKQGITTGTTATTFSPNATCTRAQVVTFLWRAMGEPEPVSTRNPFTDLNPNEYYMKAILWAYENNITTGATAATFAPNGRCTRAQVVTFLYRTLVG